jgi:hypothetical protein
MFILALGNGNIPQLGSIQNTPYFRPKQQSRMGSNNLSESFGILSTPLRQSPRIEFIQDIAYEGPCYRLLKAVNCRKHQLHFQRALAHKSAGSRWDVQSREVERGSSIGRDQSSQDPDFFKGTWSANRSHLGIKNIALEGTASRRSLKREGKTLHDSGGTVGVGVVLVLQVHGNQESHQPSVVWQ